MDILSFYESERKDFSRKEENFMMSVYDKKRLKLDLTNKVKKQDNNNAVLTSPDLIKLKLDSPELERIILATAGSATPTPKQYRRIKGASDLTVKEQQEQYVRGFEDALNKMRQEARIAESNEDVAVNVSTVTTNNNIVYSRKTNENEIGLQVDSAVSTGPSYSYIKQFSTTANSFPSTSFVNTNSSVPIVSASTHNLSSAVRNKKANTRAIDGMPCIQIEPSKAIIADDITAAELLVDPVSVSTDQFPETVCEQSHHSSVATISTIPIDLHQQEEVKTERKKHRNRVAASKCRKRKLERESNLQETVNELKTRHNELSNMAAILRQQVCDLKLQVMDHMKSGCEVLPVQTA